MTLGYLKFYNLLEEFEMYGVSSEDVEIHIIYTKDHVIGQIFSYCNLIIEVTSDHPDALENSLKQAINRYLNETSND